MTDPFDLGPHAAYILAAYGVAAVVLVGLTLATWLDAHRQKRLADALDRRTGRRRGTEEAP